MVLAHRNNVSDKELISHYEWMLSKGIIKHGGSGWKRLEELRTRVMKHRKYMVRKYGKSYGRVKRWTL